MLAVDPAAWDESGAVSFRVLAAPLTVPGPGDPAGPLTLLEQTLDPRERVADRRWVPVAADLTRWAGQTVRLTLRTDPLERDNGRDAPLAGWGTPVVVATESARAPLAAPGSAR
jgi:hypothetical protein